MNPSSIEYYKQYYDCAVPLFEINPLGKLRIFNAVGRLRLAPDVYKRLSSAFALSTRMYLYKSGSRTKYHTKSINIYRIGS